MPLKKKNNEKGLDILDIKIYQPQPKIISFGHQNCMFFTYKQEDQWNRIQIPELKLDTHKIQFKSKVVSPFQWDRFFLKEEIVLV